MQPAVKRTVRMVSPQVSMSMSSEQTRAQVWKVVWRRPFWVVSDMRVTSNIGVVLYDAKVRIFAGGLDGISVWKILGFLRLAEIVYLWERS